MLTYVVTCPGNKPGAGSDLICGAALRSCPKQGDVRFWVYESKYDLRTKQYKEPTLRTEPPYVCLGPAEAATKAAVDPRIAVVAQVRSDWRSFGLPGATVTTEPGGTTLVRALTRFSTPTPPTASLPPKPVLGMQVTLSITATRYHWDFGDGTGADAAGPRPTAEHLYGTAGPKDVRLQTTYTATFTIAGSPTVYPLDGTAVVPGPPTLITAREARTQLEAG